MPKGDRDILKADPEDGTTPIANLLLEAIAMANLSGKEKGAISFLWRRTYGWQEGDRRKTEDEISLPAWASALNTTIPYAVRLLNKLTEKRVILRVDLGKGMGYRYSMNTRINEWDKSCLNGEELSKRYSEGLSKRNRVLLSKRITPSATILASSKESIKKDIKESSRGSRGGMGGTTAAKGYRSDYTFDMFCKDRESLKRGIGFDFDLIYFSEPFSDDDIASIADEWGASQYIGFQWEYDDESDDDSKEITKGADYSIRFDLIGLFLGRYREFLILEGLILKDEATGKLTVSDEVIKVLLDSFSPHKSYHGREPTSRLLRYLVDGDEFDRGKLFREILPLLKE